MGCCNWERRLRYHGDVKRARDTRADTVLARALNVLMPTIVGVPCTTPLPTKQGAGGCAGAVQVYGGVRRCRQGRGLGRPTSLAAVCP